MKIILLFTLGIFIMLANVNSHATTNLPHLLATEFQANNQQHGISEQEAVAIAQKQINGRVLAIRRDDNVYRIKILSNQSTVHTVTINAMDGKIIPAH